MSLRAVALARALGVWWDPVKRNGAMSGLVVTDREATPGMRQLLVQTNVAADSSWAADAWAHIDARTLALILLGHRRGLRVDIGECPACRERGYSRRGSVHATRDGQRKFAARLRACGLTVAESGSHGRYETDGTCPACTVDGQPTGRHLLAWPDAILAAMTRRCDDKYCDDGVTVQGGHPPAKCPFCDDGIMHGDPATRDALGVLADHMQANPDPCAFCRGSRWGYLVDKIGPGVTIEEMNPRREICMICEGSGVDEHGAHKVQIGQCLAAWLCGALADLDGVLERLVDGAIVNAE